MRTAPGKVFSAQFSHDGSLLLTASMDQSARSDFLGPCMKELTGG